MVSYYYKRVLSFLFKNRFIKLLDELEDKKIIIYGSKAELEYLYENFNLEALNIIAITNQKFLFGKTFLGKKIIPLKSINKLDYDYILVISTNYKLALEYLERELDIDKSRIKIAIQDIINDEARNMVYLERKQFSKRLDTLNKNLSGKKILLYGAGAFLEVITKYYDLSKLDIIGVVDRRFTVHDENETFCGYKVYAPEEISKVNPDYLVMSTIVYLTILFNIYPKYLKHTNIKIIPLVKRTLWELLQEI